jgi:hypothetical protein
MRFEGENELVSLNLPESDHSLPGSEPTAVLMQVHLRMWTGAASHKTPSARQRGIVRSRGGRGAQDRRGGAPIRSRALEATVSDRQIIVNFLVRAAVPFTDQLASGHFPGALTLTGFQPTAIRLKVVDGNIIAPRSGTIPETYERGSEASIDPR